MADGGASGLARAANANNTNSVTDRQGQVQIAQMSMAGFCFYTHVDF
jgi:hypothetical protein